jgi:threonine/homoserine/homoserine lactone efflux protein
VSYELFVAFVVFAMATLFTPGPNNVMLMASGLNFGFARTLPHVLGVTLGFGFLVLVVGFGLGAVFATYPAIYTTVKVVGTAYLIYLAWRIATAGAAKGEGGGRPFTFVQAAAFQWVNAKGLVMAIGAVSAYAGIAPYPQNILVLAGVFTLFGAASSTTWLLFGTALKRVVSDPRSVTIFNRAMAALLVLSLVPVFLEG